MNRSTEWLARVRGAFIVVSILIGVVFVCGQDVMAVPLTIHGKQDSFFALFVPWTVVQKRLEGIFTRVANNRDLHISDQTWQIDKMNWQFRGITLNSNAALSQSTLTPSTFAIATDYLWLSAQIREIYVDQIVRKVIHGVDFNVHLKATCGPISLMNHRAQAQLKIGYRISSADIRGDIHADLKSFKLNWPASSWTIAPIRCEGPNGFSTTMTKFLRQQLNNTAMLEAVIEKNLKKNLNTSLDNEHKRFQAFKSGMLIQGEKTNLPVTMADVAHFNEPVLLSDRQILAEFIQQKFSTLPDRITVDLNKVDFFENLVNSRFANYFIWPDLANFKYGSPFTLIMNRPRLSGFRWSASGESEADIDTSGWVTALRDGQYWHYVAFTGRGDFQFRPLIDNGRLTLLLTLNNGLLLHEFGERYLERFDNRDFSDFLNDKYLVKEAQKTVKKYRISQQLKTVDLGLLGSAKLNGWQALRDGIIAIPLKLKTSGLKTGDGVGVKIHTWPLNNRGSDSSIFQGASLPGHR